MEDEECLPENSSLKLYLQNLGFTDFPVTKIPPRDPPSLKFEAFKPKTDSVETIDEEIVDQISIIISTQMLFEEDISKLEKLLSNLKVVKNGMLKSMFKNLFGVAVIFLGLCLFWVIGYYALFIVSAFYAFNAAEYLSRKHFNRNRLKKLTSILQANFMLLKKTVKFIEENRSLEASICKSNSVELMEGFDFYNNFKSDFLISVNEMINIFVKSTQKLIYEIPLCDYIERPEFYLCNNYKEGYESISLSHLYEMYLLVQSEFLQRLILSLIPNVKLSTKDGFRELNKILTETCIGLLKLKNKLNKKFKFLFLNGIYSPKSEIQFKLPSRHNYSDTYCNEFILNIHETSKTFQKLLLKCRILEEKIMSDKISEYVEQELVSMQQDLNTCQRNISDSLILYKKTNFIRDNPHVNEVKVQDEKDLESYYKGSNKVQVGYSDFDPKIEDEIFEAYFSKENTATSLSDSDIWDLEEKLMRKQKKEFCSNVMNELKIKIKDKAKYWRKREKELLRKKGCDIGEFKEETETTDEEEEGEVEDILKLSKCQKMYNICESKTDEFKNFEDDIETSELPSECQLKPDENLIESGIINEKNTFNLPNESSKSDIACENFNRSFLSDLNQARQRIFKSCAAVEEESFYASGEDSSSEENHQT